MTEFESASASERRFVISVANNRPIASDEMLSSPLKVACAAFLAVEESWGETETLEVLNAIAPNLSNGDSSVVAAVAIRGAMLDTWWVRGGENPKAWDRALSWANIATTARPDWLLGWLVTVDGHLFRRETDQALVAAERTLHVQDPGRVHDEFIQSAEEVFGGRSGWTRRQAEELVTRVREGGLRGTTPMTDAR